MQRITMEFLPDENVRGMLHQHGIPDEFIDDAVPEFVIYWMERGEAKHSWGSTFIKHCIRVWREQQTTNHLQQRQHRMTRDWRPDEMTVNALVAEGIPIQVIQGQLPEFILYWMEHGLACATWNAKFLAHVRRNQHTKPQSTRDLSLVDQLTDRSWADGGSSE